MRLEGFELFFPEVDIPVRVQKPKRVPMFPGYLFLRCDILGHRLPMVSRLPGVFGWVRVGGDIPSVPDDVIDGLRARVDSIHTSGGMWESFKPGQLVQVARGKMEGVATVLAAPKTPQDRVRVLLEFMGRQVQATVPWHSLNPLSEDQADRELRRHRRRTRGRGRWINGFGPRAAAHT